MINILFASNNRGKYDELKKDFSKVGLNLLFYTDLQDKPLELKENSEIMFLNAKEKALSSVEEFKDKNENGRLFEYVLGDDSGLFVEALSYFPGVHSRRWAGNESSNDDNLRAEYIVEMMNGLDKRNAFLLSEFYLISYNGKDILRTSVKNNFIIADSVSEGHGFGYDSILIPENYMLKEAYDNEKISFEEYRYYIDKKLTVSQYSQEGKNAINNRGRIAKKIADYLPKYNKDENGGVVWLH